MQRLEIFAGVIHFKLQQGSKGEEKGEVKT